MENEKDKLMRYDDSHSIFGMILAIIGQTVLTLLVSLFFSVVLSVFVVLFFPNADVTKSVTNIYNAFDLDLVIYIIVGGIMVLLYFLLMGKEYFKSILRGFKNKKLILWGIGLGLLLTFISSGYSIIVGQFVKETNANQSQIASTVTKNYVLSFLMIVAVAPVVEELGFRYFIFGSLKRKSRVLAYLLSAVIFALIHFSVLIGESNIDWVAELTSFPTYLFAGVFLCFVYDKSERLACPIMAHATNNFIAFISLILANLIK